MYEDLEIRELRNSEIWKFERFQGFGSLATWEFGNLEIFENLEIQKFRNWEIKNLGI